MSNNITDRLKYKESVVVNYNFKIYKKLSILSR